MINSGTSVSVDHCSGWHHSTSSALGTVATGEDGYQDLGFSLQPDSSLDFEAGLDVDCSVLDVLFVCMPGSFMITGKIEPWCCHFDFTILH